MLFALTLTTALILGCSDSVGVDAGDVTSPSTETVDTAAAPSSSVPPSTETTSPIADDPSTGVDEAAALSDGDGGAVVVDDEGVPFYSGFDSPEGWRLAPVSEVGALVTYWNGDGYRITGHAGLASRSPLEPIGVGTISALENGYEFVYLQLEGDEQTIWRHDGDGELTAVVTVPEPQRIDLEGLHVRDLGDVDMFYQIRFPGSPEDTVDKLFRHHLPSGEVTEIMETGGWESGADFHDVVGAYPLTLATRFAEATTWHQIIDLETGSIVYDGAAEDETCFDGAGDCAVYDAATLVDGDIIGVRGDFDTGSGIVGAMALARFDPDTGVEEVIARFEWDNGLWYPRGMMVGGLGVIMSVGDFEGSTAYPALTIDPLTGQAETLELAGFVVPAYLS